jgi:hypothetical protein
LRALLLPIIALVLLLFGCPDGENGKPCFVGDPAQSPELMIIHRTTTGTFQATTASGTVPLIEPPQGGKVIFVAARARNLDGCPIRLRASLRDECTNQLLAVEERDVVLRQAADGWLEPEDPVEIANYSNLPACPRANAQRDVEGEPYLLKVTLTDRAGRTAESSLRVMPVCAEPMLLEACLCECDKDYALSTTCNADVDSGVAPGTCPPDGGM